MQIGLRWKLFLALKQRVNQSFGEINGGPPADLLINQGVWDNVSGHTSRA